MKSFVVRNRKKNELFSSNIPTDDQGTTVATTNTTNNDKQDSATFEAHDSASVTHKIQLDTSVLNNDNSADDDSASSSSSSSSDDSILSDTQDTILLMKQQAKVWYRKQLRHQRHQAKDKSNNPENTESRILENSNDKGDDIDKKLLSTSTEGKVSRNRRKQQMIIIARIKQKLVQQFQYRNQIWDHLLRIYFPKQYYDTSSSTTATTLYLKSVLQREIQARYYKIDCIIQKLKCRQERSVSTCSTTSSSINSHYSFTMQEFEELRQQLYGQLNDHQPQIPTPLTSFFFETHNVDKNANVTMYIQKHETTTTSTNPSDSNAKSYVEKIRQMRQSSATTAVVSKINPWTQKIIPIDQDDLLFARHIIVPAIYTLLIHSMVHTCIYDGCLAVRDELKSRFYIPSITYIFGFFMDVNGRNTSGSIFDLMWIGIVFIFGASLLRCTGDIYWWSSYDDYQLIKFDFHNRRQILQLHLEQQRQNQVQQGNVGSDSKSRIRRSGQYPTCAMTRVVMWIRQHDVIRATIFMFGYTLCYIASFDSLRYMTRVFFLYFVSENWNYTNVISKLPSTIAMSTNGVCLVERDIDESFCSYTCQNELERRSNEFATLKLMDMEYTRNELSADSFDTFWNYWIHNIDMGRFDYPGSLIIPAKDHCEEMNGKSSLIGDLPPLFLKHQQLSYYCIVIITSIWILCKCGVKLWEKY